LRSANKAQNGAWNKVVQGQDTTIVHSIDNKYLPVIVWGIGQYKAIDPDAYHPVKPGIRSLRLSYRSAGLSGDSYSDNKVVKFSALPGRRYFADAVRLDRKARFFVIDESSGQVVSGHPELRKKLTGTYYARKNARRQEAKSLKSKTGDIGKILLQGMMGY